MDAMNKPLEDLIDDYLSGLLDEPGLRELEDHLRADADARRLFVRCCRLHTDLHLEARARQASARALSRIDQLTAEPRGGIRAVRWLVAAACLLLAVGAVWWVVRSGGSPGPREAAVGWLVNAQNCRWSEGEPAGDMHAGTVLKLERGLAEVRFQCGARVVLEGPATLELLSGKSARLQRGRLTARVPEPAVGFEVVSPQGKVIDLGTEFGIAVAEDGAAEVCVFEGKVEAQATQGVVSLTQNQAARIAEGKVRPIEPDAAGPFVRAILPPPTIVPRTLRLTFSEPLADGVCDLDGRPTGLTHRLPGTGLRLAEHDPNLRLNLQEGRLELTTTNSDLNTQYRLQHGEYLGVRLADLGFTGSEDFAVTVTLPDIPALEVIGQFGLYAGARSDRNIRGGLLSARRQEPGQYTQFLVNNVKGCDQDIHRVGLLPSGADLHLTLKRTAGQYALTVDDLKQGGSSTLTIRHPAFLDGERDLCVGLFGANTQSEVRRTLLVKEFSVTVWTTVPAPGDAQRQARARGPEHATEPARRAD
jgi:ferric-dicitrate binding protein FerR (iron transport regulator)